MTEKLLAIQEVRVDRETFSTYPLGDDSIVIWTASYNDVVWMKSSDWDLGKIANHVSFSAKGTSYDKALENLINLATREGFRFEDEEKLK